MWWNISFCQTAPLRPVTQRCSMMPSSGSRQAASMPESSSPRCASGSSRRRTSSGTGTSPVPGQYSRASMPCRAAVCRLSSAAWKDIRDHTGRSSSTRARVRP